MWLLKWPIWHPPSHPTEWQARFCPKMTDKHLPSKFAADKVSWKRDIHFNFNARVCAPSFPPLVLANTRPKTALTSLRFNSAAVQWFVSKGHCCFADQPTLTWPGKRYPPLYDFICQEHEQRVLIIIYIYIWRRKNLIPYNLLLFFLSTGSLCFKSPGRNMKMKQNSWKGSYKDIIIQKAHGLKETNNQRLHKMCWGNWQATNELFSWLGPYMHWEAVKWPASFSFSTKGEQPNHYRSCHPSPLISLGVQKKKRLRYN